MFLPYSRQKPRFLPLLGILYEDLKSLRQIISVHSLSSFRDLLHLDHNIYAARENIGNLLFLRNSLFINLLDQHLDKE